MKRRIIYVLAVVLLLLVGCNMNPNDAMVVCGTYGVPGFIVRDMKGSTGPIYSCTELERDSKGRLLYEFSTINILSGEWETAVVVCQKYDNKFVFFYEDKCYGYKNDESLSIDQLKLQNDWDQPLDYDKMSRREIHIAIPAYVMIPSELAINEVRSACQEKIEDGRIIFKEIQFIDSDGYGHELYYFTVSNSADRYFAIVDGEYQVALLEVKEELDASVYVAFKQENGWIYPG